MQRKDKRDSTDLYFSGTTGRKVQNVRRIINTNLGQEISIEELSERSGVKLEVLKAMENGEVIPSLTPLTKMARALGVRLGTFLDDTPELGPVVTRGGKPKTHFTFQDVKT